MTDLSKLKFSGKVKNVNIIHKWLKDKTYQHCVQVVKRLNMCVLYTGG